MEFIIVLLILTIIYFVLKFIQKVLQKLVAPPFDREAYRKAQVEALENHSDHSRVESLRKANAELKEKQEKLKAVDQVISM